MPDIDSAISEALMMASQVSAETQMLFLPEYCGGLRVSDGKFAPPLAPYESHPFIAAVQGLAKEKNCWVMIGSVAVPSNDGLINNRGVVIDSKGVIRSSYNKIHLFDIQLSDDEVYRESDVIAPGNELSITDTPVGRLGHTICYDLRFAGLYRSLSQAGAEVLAIPAAFTRTTGEAHWHVLCRARAIENGAYVIAPCAVGDVPGGGGSYGHSLVVDPWGEVVADGGQEPGVVEATIDLARVHSARSKIPSLQHDRQWRSIAQNTAVNFA